MNLLRILLPISAISHPKFKLSWVPEEHVVVCKQLFLDECQFYVNCNQPSEYTILVIQLLVIKKLLIFLIIIYLKI